MPYAILHVCLSIVAVSKDQHLNSLALSLLVSAIQLHLFSSANPFFSFHLILYNNMVWTEAPRLSSQLDGKSRNDFLDVDFEERLKTVRRCTLHFNYFTLSNYDQQCSVILFPHYTGQHLSRRRQRSKRNLEQLTMMHLFLLTIRQFPFLLRYHCCFLPHKALFSFLNIRTLYMHVTIIIQIGVGVAVVVFGLVFAFGDFLPSGRYACS